MAQSSMQTIVHLKTPDNARTPLQDEGESRSEAADTTSNHNQDREYLETAEARTKKRIRRRKRRHSKNKNVLVNAASSLFSALGQTITHLNRSVNGDTTPNSQMGSSKQHQQKPKEQQQYHQQQDVEEEEHVTEEPVKTPEEERKTTWSSTDIPSHLQKYYLQRHRLFSLFDNGIQIDQEGWFSVTPESIAKHIAHRMKGCGVICDAFGGVGGNTVQFAKICCGENGAKRKGKRGAKKHKVVAVEIDPVRMQCSKNNARVYGVQDRIQFLQGDFFELVKKGDIKCDAIFLSPPWGGPQYLSQPTFSISNITIPTPSFPTGQINGWELLEIALGVTPNVAYFLPRNQDGEELLKFAKQHDLLCEVEEQMLNGKIKTITVYFGNLVSEQCRQIASECEYGSMQYANDTTTYEEENQQCGKENEWMDYQQFSVDMYGTE